jgi:hypothetical protein
MPSKYVKKYTLRDIQPQGELPTGKPNISQSYQTALSGFTPGWAVEYCANLN